MSKNNIPKSVCMATGIYMWNIWKTNINMTGEAESHAGKLLGRTGDKRQKVSGCYDGAVHIH